MEHFGNEKFNSVSVIIYYQLFLIIRQVLNSRVNVDAQILLLSAGVEPAFQVF
jgi:hypothetical protein